MRLRLRWIGRFMLDHFPCYFVVNVLSRERKRLFRLTEVCRHAAWASHGTVSPWQASIVQLRFNISTAPAFVCVFHCALSAYFGSVTSAPSMLATVSTI